MFNLNGKTALVTGAGRGIGQHLAMGLAEAGANVAMIARNLGELEETASEIQRKGRKVWFASYDLRNTEGISELVKQIETEFAPLDILVNNAGMNNRQKTFEITVEGWNEVLDLNLKASVFLMKAVGERMCERGAGSIINISSVAGTTALRTGVSYGSSKAALNHATRITAVEWAPRNVRVNAVAPWYFRTPLTEPLLQNESYKNEILDHTPMKRIGELRELVGPVVFLASDASSYVTGQVIHVDGGMTSYGF